MKTSTINDEFENICGRRLIHNILLYMWDRDFSFFYVFVRARKSVFSSSKCISNKTSVNISIVCTFVIAWDVKTLRNTCNLLWKHRQWMTNFSCWDVLRQRSCGHVIAVKKHQWNGQVDYRNGILQQTKYWKFTFYLSEV